MKVPKLDDLLALPEWDARRKIGWTCRELKRRIAAESSAHIRQSMESDLVIAKALRLVFEEAKR